MAQRAVTLTPRWPGALSGALVLVLTLGTLAAVGWRAEWAGGLSPADWAAVRFTVTQAFVSAAVSVICAIPVARALARRRFVGRKVLITLLGAPFLLPVIVAILGLLAVFGRGGLLNDALGTLGELPVDMDESNRRTCLNKRDALDAVLAARLAGDRSARAVDGWLFKMVFAKTSSSPNPSRPG